MENPRVARGERGWFGEPNAPAAEIPTDLERWFEGTAAPPEGEAPVCAVYLGGVGAGKTTIRRREHADLVAIDPAEVYNFLTDGGRIVPANIGELYETVGQRLAIDALRRKRNIVIELIGAEYEPVHELIEQVKGGGFKVALVSIECDPVEAYKRHLDAATNDPTYVSAWHYECDTERWIRAAARIVESGLSDLPIENIHVFAPLDPNEDSPLYQEAFEEFQKRQSR